MTNLKIRIEKLEAKHQPNLPTEFIRIIQHGDMTPGQEQQIAEAQAKGVGIICRVIVRP